MHKKNASSANSYCERGFRPGLSQPAALVSGRIRNNSSQNLDDLRTGKSVEGQRVAEGPAVAKERSNFRGAKEAGAGSH